MDIVNDINSNKGSIQIFDIFIIKNKNVHYILLAHTDIKSIFKKDLDEGEFIKMILQEYSPKIFQKNVFSDDILYLSFLKKLEYDSMRCFSFNNKNVRQGWKKFLDDLPDSQYEIVPRIEERYHIH